MTGQAVTREPEIGPVQVCDLDRLPLGASDALRAMALITGQTGVAAFQGVTGFSVIEFQEARLPADQWKVLAIVFGVAAHTILSRGILLQEGGVQPAPRSQALADLGMTVEAFEFGRPYGEAVALRALRDSAQRAVRFGQGSWRNLRPRGNGSAEDHER